MLSIKYFGVFEGGFTSGFVISPAELRQGNSKFLGILLDWEGKHEGFELEHSVSFNTVWSGLIKPNFRIQPRDQEFIDGILVKIKRTGIFGFLNPPAFKVVTFDSNGNEFRGGNEEKIHIPNGMVSFRVELE
jgi:hypothetical protein